MNDSPNNNPENEAAACFFNKAFGEMRSDFLGGADLRKAWMAEYAIQVEEEEVELVQKPQHTPQRTALPRYQRDVDGDWLT